MDLETVVLKHGSHRSIEQGACAMEMVSFLAGEPWSDHPACTCPVIAAMVRGLNDCISDDAMRTELLKPLLPKLLGTAGSRELRIRRAYMAADAAIHIFAPAALEHAKKPELAAKLRAAPEVVDRASAARARDIAREVRAYAAAAYASAAAASADAAYASADAAYAAAASADAASADAASASRQAARRGEYAKLVDLIERLCALKDAEAA